MEEIAKVVTNYGLMAGLFIWSLIKTQKQNELREAKYQDTIKELSFIIKDNMKCLENKIDNFKDKIDDIVDKIK